MANTNQFSKILQGKIWKFFGGIKPVGLKHTSTKTIETLPIPSLITLPLDRHLGVGGQVLVKVGDYVKKGQMLTMPGGNKNVPLHASTSGHVTSISKQVLPHPSGFSGMCITIKPDMLDTECEREAIDNWAQCDSDTLIKAIRKAGVEGLGGAQFQTATKFSSTIESCGNCSIFIVNGCECEPVATCDDRLMQERADEIAKGIEIIQHILKPTLSVVAIEDNKAKAIEAMKEAISHLENVEIRVIPTVYPSGAARNLIKIITGIEIPYNKHTSDCGIVVDNVETVFAIKRAIVDGIPLIERVVTIAGDNLSHQGNAFVRLGTSVRFLLNQYKLTPERRQRVILGGPFMGFTLPSIDVPITKATTCVIAPSTKEFENEPLESNCIRCGRCARVCPSRLTPYLMYAYSKASDHNNAKKCGIADCTECGCCAYVCPSKINLTGQFRKEKAIQKLISEKQERNIRAKERQAIRQERERKEKEIREAKKKAALERIARQQSQNGDTNASSDFDKRRQEAAELARARAKARREALLQKTRDSKTQSCNDAQNIKDKATIAQNTDKTSKAQGTILSIKVPGKDTNNTLKIKGVISNKDVLDNNAVLSLNGQSKDLEVNKKAINLPYNLRQGSIAKHASIFNTWPQSVQYDPMHIVVENPPTHVQDNTNINETRVHSIFDSNIDTKEKTKKIPKSLLRKGM